MAGSYIHAIVFYATAALAIASAFLVVWNRRPVVSALYLVVCFFAVAVAYVLLHAHFLAAIQVLLYAGAVLVLFLMIMMLVKTDPREVLKAKPTVTKALGLAAVFALGVIMVAVLFPGYRAQHVIGLATPEDVVMFLTKRGAHPSEFEFKVTNPRAKKIGVQDEKLIAMSLLRDFQEDPDFARFVPWPEKYADMSRVERKNIAKELFGSIRRMEPEEGLDILRVPESLKALFRLDENEREMLVGFVEALAKGRVRQFENFGTTEAVGAVLFSRYLLPFEAASILLLAAILGVMVLARGGKDGGS